MKNVTITMDPEVASWARIRAARLDTSVSRMVGEMLRELMDREERYGVVMNRYLARKPVLVSEPGTVYPGRAEVHDRSDLR